jgi:glycosyltransferase involved in cell wall biosynthesis
MKKKVCLAVTDAVSFNVLCHGQLEYLSSDPSIELTLICGGSDRELELLRSRGVGEIVKVGIRRKPSLISDVFVLLFLIRFFFSRRFDLVVYSTPKAMLLVGVAAFFSGQKKRVALVRGRVYENFVGLKRVIYSNLDRLVFLMSTKVVFISRSLMHAFVSESLVSAVKSVVVGRGSSNGVDVSRFSDARADSSARAAFKSSLGYAADDVLIVVVGRICRDKGISELKSVVNRVKIDRANFLVVGHVEDDFSAKILSDISASKRVKHLPFVGDVAKVFAIADIHLFLSLREGFGNVAIEAAASGVPTLAFDVIGVRDSVEEGVSGIRYKLGDFDRMAEQIDSWAAEGVNLENSSDLIGSWVRDNFERSYVWRCYRDFYCSMMGVSGLEV